MNTAPAAGLNATTVPELIEALGDSDPDRQAEAAQVLRSLGTAAVPALIDAVWINPPEIKLEARPVVPTSAEHDPEEISPRAISIGLFLALALALSGAAG